MRRFFAVALFIVLVGVGLYFLWSPLKKGTDDVYLLPNHFEGCVFVYYDVPYAPPLLVEEGRIVYEVPKDGVIQTSSPMDFGWAYKDHSGAFQTNVFYVDEAGNKLKELPDEFLAFGANGSYEGHGGDKQDYMYVVFGEDEVCDSPKYYE